MKICFVGPADSVHIVKWCTWFSNRGHIIHVISFIPGEIPNTKVHLIDIGVNTQGSDIEKLKYLLTGKKLKKIINAINPDIINVHYATSYGTAMALSGINNYILSVWGADIYDFPRKSIFHKILLKLSLKKAAYLFSTSQAMADEAKKYTNKLFEITPFGIDMEVFNPKKRTRVQGQEPVMVGIVSSLPDLHEHTYFFEAVSEIKKNFQKFDILIKITGEKAYEYKKLIQELDLEDCTVFLEKNFQEEVMLEWKSLDVAVIPVALWSLFGVIDSKTQDKYIPMIVSGIEKLFTMIEMDNIETAALEKDIKTISEKIIRLYNYLEQKNYRKSKKSNYFQRTELSKEAIKSFAQSIMISVTIKKKEDFIIGTVKSLSDKYGISYILQAAAKIKERKLIPIKLRIAGKGIQEQEYYRLACKLGINEITTWLGFISQEEAAVEWANMDVAVIPSTLESESFGVSAVESQACGTAVIISDIPGLMEATKPGKSSIVVPRNDVDSIVKAIEKLFFYPKLRKNYADYGRTYVEKYELSKCFLHIENKFIEYSKM